MDESLVNHIDMLDKNYISGYNCMGYALGFKKWLLVYNSYEETAKMLEEHYPLKPVKRKDMKLGRKYIAYRYGRQDFHFVKRDRNGNWSHKRGSHKPEAISKKEVFSNKWINGNIVYNSKLYLYEVLA